MSDTTHSRMYESPADALEATNDFYEDGGFSYTDDQVRQWLEVYLRRFPRTGRVLDLCCGDGIWARGMKTLNPSIEMYGVDISEAGIRRARELVDEDPSNFQVADTDAGLPWPDGTFDLIFARGPGLFNQHSMDRPATVGVIEMWHRALKPDGHMVSMFYSDPIKFGTYTNPLNVKLPYNRAPRLTDAVDFTGGKYHHDVGSFHAPFWRARNVEVIDYRFVRKNHILESRIVG